MLGSICDEVRNIYFQDRIRQLNNDSLLVDYQNLDQVF